MRRAILAVVGALTLGGVATAGEPKMEELIARQVACRAPSPPGAALLDLKRANLIDAKPVWVTNRLNYFKLKRPLMVEGLRVVGVFGFDDSGQFPFVRSRGTGPADVFGVVTSSSDTLIARWRSRYAGKEIVWDNESDFGPGFAQIYCSKASGADE
ncbi:hypothetical protein [Chelatococcus reniformis]|uniref:Uncharacterized protein n=1 Tax=Chelatococcus reniformis TaxID=1494448 RepID=A0A916UNQ6_9HYPH|nr:hypothetical protein [Chelatococcus reniformis]GGC77476.1 hypothetical protein GCM10010994_39720 [Chelatococcus reniformis]